MKERLFYCTEAEKLYTLSELRAFYENEAGRDTTWFYGFPAWLNSCLYENNGTLVEIKKLFEIGTTTVYNLKSDL